MKPTVITLCGSTKFKKEYIEQQRRLTLEGYIVLTVGFWGHIEARGITVEQKVNANRLHLCKIDISSEIFVINPGGYIGESTVKEIRYAKMKKKTIKYLISSGEKT